MSTSDPNHLNDPNDPYDPYPDAEPQFAQPPLKAKKGRGAVSNLQGRYEVLTREDIDDGWSGAHMDANMDDDRGKPGNCCSDR